MRLKAVMTASVGLLMLGSAGAYAQPKIYPYHSKENFCPVGLQPVTMDGTICCGNPNQNMSYQSVMATGKARKGRVRSAQETACPMGAKGCDFK